MSTRAELATIRDLLARHPLLTLVPASKRRTIVGQAAAIFMERGEILYVAGDPADRIYVVLEGALQIEYPERQNRRGRVAAILEAPALLGECQVLHGLPWSGTGVVLRPLVALGIHKEQLEALILAHPRFALQLYREVTWRFLRAIEGWKASPSVTPERALARYVLGHLVALGTSRRTCPALALTQQELGRASGLRRETVNRLLRRWARQGWLRAVPAGLLDIDVCRLAEVAESPGEPAITQNGEPAQAVEGGSVVGLNRRENETGGQARSRQRRQTAPKSRRHSP
jgi:CRP/FNR family transcriptional regulator